MTNSTTPSIADEAVQRNPLLLARHLLSGPTVYRDPGTGMPWVGRYGTVSAILGDPETYSSRNPMIFSRSCSPIADEVYSSLKARGFAPVDTLVTNDPPAHRHYRRIVERIFSPAVVRRLEGDIRAIADELLDEIVTQDRVEIMKTLALKLPIFFILGQLGVSRDDYAKVKYWADISIERISPVIPPATAPAVVSPRQYIARIRMGELTLAAMTSGRVARNPTFSRWKSTAADITIAPSNTVASLETRISAVSLASPRFQKCL
mgnify:CR=1 FL=1